MEWSGEQFVAQVEAKARRNVEAACIHVQNQVRFLISTPSRTVTYAQRKNRKGEMKTKKILGPRGSNRSKPGEAPHKDTGTLRSSIAHQMQEGPSGLVGSALAYARHLELGTKKMAPRPYLRRTLAQEKPAIVEIITTL
jgi:HK97 gp10 family phage protein